MREATVLFFFFLLACGAGVSQATDYFDVLQQGQRLNSGDRLVSRDGILHLDMQPDGNLVLYDEHRIICGFLGLFNCKTYSHYVIWAINGNYAAATPNYAVQQADGVFAVYNRNGARLYGSNVATGILADQPFELTIFHNQVSSNQDTGNIAVARYSATTNPRTNQPPGFQGYNTIVGF